MAESRFTEYKVVHVVEGGCGTIFLGPFQVAGDRPGLEQPDLPGAAQTVWAALPGY